jgi:hypothetical protein
MFPENREGSLNGEAGAANASLCMVSQRVCFSLDDVSSGQAEAASGPVAASPTSSSQQPMSLPLAQNGKATTWLHNIIFAPRQKGVSASNKNLMSWPIRTDLSKRSVTKSTKSCCDVNSQENII